MPNPGPVPDGLEDIVRRALEEDLGGGDVTTACLVGADLHARADLIFREPGVVAGLPAAEAAFLMLSAGCRFSASAEEGEAVEAGSVAACIDGPACAVLSAERVALNLAARLSGIATLTARFVEAVAGTQTRILDTRKTTPLLRPLEKYAVRAGGGANHRMGLYDAVLIKDNHLELAKLTAAEAVERAKARCELAVEVEVESVEAALAAARAGADIIMLDNFSARDAVQAAAKVRAEFPRGIEGSPLLEISGCVTLENVRTYAEAGADWISVGALTRSARSLDISLDIVGG